MRVFDKLVQKTIEQEAHEAGLEKSKIIKRIVEGLDALLYSATTPEGLPDWKTRLKSCELGMELLRMNDKQAINVFVEPLILKNEDGKEILTLASSNGHYAP